MRSDPCQLVLPPGFESDPEIDSLLEAVKASDLALVIDDHDAVLRAAAPEMRANVPANFVMDREMLRQGLALNMITYERYVRRVEHLSRRPNGEYLIMGEEEVFPKSSNVRLDGGKERRRFTDIWRQEGQSWLLSVRHATAINPD
ncbi:nuclear transport factor 2 family protein [Asticcacaulis sp. AC402]|uniref:nuclear transport factor 2 family protein n=1 Tax=Asticcacaulis sp. AC402 TaxID=1282361 RepID=UPI0003C3AF7E|nr:nuclear transport factor 2 family protein [Asticcacaulis sp. AC402]ESQ74286.1 hypothetical protein ABAC402_15070 [Asticcacaulis sp. AC402]